jgi:hypothetical protein
VTELAHCPRCGGAETRIREIGTVSVPIDYRKPPEPVGYVGYCTRCGAESGLRLLREKAVVAWNRFAQRGGR